MTVTPKRLLRALDARDGHQCVWHYPGACDVETLVPQHRGNRGIGGRASAMVLPNLVWLCSTLNGLIEADAVFASSARNRGIKISSHADPEVVPVRYSEGWFLLTGEDRTGLRDDEAAELMSLAGIPRMVAHAF